MKINHRELLYKEGVFSLKEKLSTPKQQSRKIDWVAHRKRIKWLVLSGQYDYFWYIDKFMRAMKDD